MRVNVTFEIPESAAARAPWFAALRAQSAPQPVPALRGDCIERSRASTPQRDRSLAMLVGRRPLRCAQRYVAHGSLSVPASAERAFDAAVHYLERDTAMRAVIAKVEHSRTSLTLRIVHDGADRYEPETGAVVWDPLSALRTTAGGRQSPALGLGHELAHAAAAPGLLDRGARLRLRGYDNAEERRVIRGAEAHAARTLGEAARTDHRGTCYRVASPVICRLAA